MLTITRLNGLIVIILFAVSCNKDTDAISTVNTKETVSETPTIQFYFRGTINGNYKDWTVTDIKNGENLVYRFNSASGVDTLSSDCVNTVCKYMLEDVVIFQNNGLNPMKNYIAAGFNISSKTGDRNEIISQFAVGPKTFGKPRMKITDPVKDGIYVFYIDENGKPWCSHWGSGNQANSVFKSEQLLPQPFHEISCRKIWKATVTCMLYDQEGNSLKVENGEFFTPVIVNY
ncbi:MAG: hypothetical protein IPP93_12315 [Chitinophagaceae bacterium]|nr:hypothetical protein [Chitinophagaceae bacterium]